MEVKNGAGAGTEVEPESDVSMSPFQATTYGSFVLTFILAGFAAVVLFRKGLDVTERRFSSSAKVLAGALVLMAMHGFFATYNYSRYLRDEAQTAPVSLTVLSWIILAVAIGYLSNRLLETKGKTKKTNALIDGFFYATIFVLITLAVSPETGANASLILSLLALVLCTVPLSRFFIAYKLVKFRRPELQHKSIKRLLYSLVLFPTVLPLVALFYTFKAFGPDTMLLGTNLISTGFVLFVSFAMLASMKALKQSEQADEAAAAPEAAPEAAPKNDPLVEELLAEEAAAQTAAGAEPAAEPPPQIKPVPEIAPEKPSQPKKPQKPGRRPADRAGKGSDKPKAPKKPGSQRKDSEKPAPNSPTKIKAPPKPKKRF
ncbi:MAG: hypothetical protein R6U56_07275 [Opitutales bacterium]